MDATWGWPAGAGSPYSSVCEWPPAQRDSKVRVESAHTTERPMRASRKRKVRHVPLPPRTHNQVDTGRRRISGQGLVVLVSNVGESDDALCPGSFGGRHAGGQNVGVVQEGDVGTCRAQEERSAELDC